MRESTITAVLGRSQRIVLIFQALKKTPHWVPLKLTVIVEVLDAVKLRL